MAVNKINPDDLESLSNENSIVVVDFWAPWCGPCRAFGPLFEQVSNETDGFFAKVNIDEYEDFALKNGISSIPTVWVFKNGKKIYSNPGMLSKQMLLDLLK